MSASNGILPRSLKPWTDDSDGTESLQDLLGRVYQERGHFRNVDESGLREEIASQHRPGQDDDVDGEDEDDVDASEGVPDGKDAKSRPEELQAVRHEMIGHVASAHNEALLALDFVSLLLSKDLPRQAELTISPALKQEVKSGSLGMDMWQNMPQDTEREHSNAALAKGWRMRYLQQSADSLLAAADRLETTVRKETQYWNELLSINERGWSVCRMPRDRHTLGVRFGFAEAQGEFKHSGLAALRANAEGHIVLDRGLGNNPKAVRVRIVKGGDVVSISDVPALNDDTEFTVEARIRHARDSLFEEELFNEMMREALGHESSGIETKGSVIVLRGPQIASENAGSDGSKGKGLQVEIELVGLASQDSHGDNSTPGSSLAQGLALYARLLLSNTHRNRLQSRSQVPPPMSTKKVDRSTVSILRPLLSVLAFRSTTESFSEYLQTVESLLSTSGLETHISNATFHPDVLGNVTTAEDMAALLSHPVIAKASLTLHPFDDQRSINSRSELTLSITIETLSNSESAYCKTTITPSPSLVDARLTGFTNTDVNLAQERMDSLLGAVLIQLAADRMQERDWVADPAARVVYVRDPARGRNGKRERQVRIRVEETEGGTRELVVTRGGEDVHRWINEGDEKAQMSFGEVLEELDGSIP